MSDNQIVYWKNSVVQTFWIRLVHSKTTWVVIAAVLERYYSYVQGDITFETFVTLAWGGVVAIMLKLSTGKAQLASDAANPDLPNVQAASYSKATRK